MKIQIPTEGEIRHPKKLPNEILKCIGPFDSNTWKDGISIPTKSFILTNEYPKPHYFVVDRIINSYFFGEVTWCLAFIITHSQGFANMKIDKHHYYHSNINLDDSYITRDKFLINIDSIDLSKVFGKFNLEILTKEMYEY